MTATSDNPLVQAIHLEPDDWVRYMVLADWYEEEGNDVMAEAVRWMVENKRQPKMVHFVGNWHAMWYDGWWGKMRRMTNTLPVELIEHMGVRDYAVWTSWEKAVKALGEGLRKWKKT